MVENNQSLNKEEKEVQCSSQICEDILTTLALILLIKTLDISFMLNNCNLAEVETSGQNEV